MSENAKIELKGLTEQDLCCVTGGDSDRKHTCSITIGKGISLACEISFALEISSDKGLVADHLKVG